MDRKTNDTSPYTGGMTVTAGHKGDVLAVRLIDGAPLDKIADVPGRYVGYFLNACGEQLLFVQDKGAQPTLYHSDLGWNARPAEMTGDVVLDGAEAMWLTACLKATEPIRERKEAS